MSIPERTDDEKPAALSLLFPFIPYLANPLNTSQNPGLRGGGGLLQGLCLVAAALRRGKSACIRMRHAAQQKELSAVIRAVFQQEAAETGVWESSKGHPTVVFGSYDFASTVGLWLKASGQPASALLSPFISTDSFEFTPAEFVDFRERIDLTMRRYAKLPPVSKSLEDLNTGFFRHRSLEESREFIASQLAKYLSRGNDLHREYLLAINGNARKLMFRRQAELLERRSQLRAINDEMDRVDRLTGRRGRRQAREAIAQWSSYRERWYGDSAPVNPQLPFPALRDSLREEGRQISLLHQNLNRELQAATLSLSPVTAASDELFSAHLKALARKLEDLLREIDEAGLYQLPLRGTDAATSPRQLQLLESLLDRLRKTHRHLHELDDFYARQHLWYAQPGRLRRLLAPLIDMPSADWKTAFTSWYFERCLQRTEFPGGNRTSPEKLAKRLEEAPHKREPAINLRERLTFLMPGEKFPERPSPDVFCLDLTGELPEDGWSADNYRCLRPLQDEEASFYQLAGRLDPGLIFAQPFLPVLAPDWAPVAASEPPPGSDGRISLQTDETAPWAPLADWDWSPSEQINIYLPTEISEGDGTLLLSAVDAVMTAAPRIRLFHNWRQDGITQALLSDGVTPSFLAAVLLRAAEAAAAEPYDREALVALGREYRTRCGLPEPGPHPLAENLLPLLAKRLPDHFFELHQAWRDTFLPLVILSPAGRKTVLLPDGRLPGKAGTVVEALRQRELRTAGFHCLDVRADQVWMNVEKELDRITAALGGAAAGAEEG